MASAQQQEIQYSNYLKAREQALTEREAAFETERRRIMNWYFTAKTQFDKLATANAGLQNQIASLLQINDQLRGKHPPTGVLEGEREISFKD